MCRRLVAQMKRMSTHIVYCRNTCIYIYVCVYSHAQMDTSYPFTFVHVGRSLLSREVASSSFPEALAQEKTPEILRSAAAGSGVGSVGGPRPIPFFARLQGGRGAPPVKANGYKDPAGSFPLKSNQRGLPQKGHLRFLVRPMHTSLFVY